MNIVTNIKEWQIIADQFNNKSVGFVPTMGNLHEGHVSLLKQAQKENDITVASIFVNPTQFNEKQDYDLYPRTLDQDIELLTSEKINYLLLPNSNEIYGDNFQFQISETELSKELEGEFRPGHFNGMLTVVLKLLNLVTPKRAYFGEKDYQQLMLVTKMVKALFLSTEIVGCPTVRAIDGVALSSRNSRLNLEERKHAAHFPRLLKSSLNLPQILDELSTLNFKVEYVVEKWNRRLGAVWLGDVRLIDNFPII